MSQRTPIHAMAGLAAVILVVLDPTAKTHRFEIACAMSLVVLIVYLIWVLVVIILENVRRPPSDNGALWDQEIDDFPDLDLRGSKLEPEENSRASLD